MSNLAPALRDTGPQAACPDYRGEGSGWANLIAATGHNNLAINHSVGQVARHFIHGNQMKEGMLNRVSAVVRGYDPCLSCSTHADGTPGLEIALKGPGGEVLDRIT
jgi:NAD-reducing hydrogenase large subunit